VVDRFSELTCTDVIIWPGPRIQMDFHRSALLLVLDRTDKDSRAVHWSFSTMSLLLLITQKRESISSLNIFFACARVPGPDDKV